MLKTVSSFANTLGALNYRGTWNAATNSPPLASGVGTKGDYYVVSTAGTTNLDGVTDWQIGDWAVFNGTIWQKVDNTDAVVSVNGQTGAVVLTASDVGAVANTTHVIAGTGLSGGGALTGNVTLNLANTAVTAGTYGGATNIPQIIIDAQGRITSAANVAISAGNGTVTNVSTGTGLTGGPITTTGTISLANTTVTAASYGGAATVATFTVDAQGRLTAAANATISIPASAINTAIPNAGLANSTTTLGNATLTLGSITTSVGNLTLTNATVNGAAFAVTTQTSAYTATGTDVTILANATGGAFSVTLPTAVGATGKIYTVKKIDSSVNAVTVATTSSQTIDNQTTEPLARQFDAVTVQSDGANWFIISFVPGRNGSGGSF